MFSPWALEIILSMCKRPRCRDSYDGESEVDRVHFSELQRASAVCSLSFNETGLTASAGGTLRAADIAVTLRGDDSEYGYSLFCTSVVERKFIRVFS
jgi:hypothetical protein